jgi:hypothetical protein
MRRMQRELVTLSQQLALREVGVNSAGQRGG